MGKAVAVFSILLLAQCANVDRKQSSKLEDIGVIGDRADDPINNFSTAEYVQACSKHKVHLPKTLDCFNENSIPLMIRDKDGSIATKYNGDEVVGYHVPLLDKDPYHYSRISRYSMSSGTECVLMCRRKQPRLEESTLFSDINLICHQPRNGATCFFNTYIEVPVSGKSLPIPGTTADKNATAYRSFWMNPKNMNRLGICTNCHTADPYLHTPYVDQAKNKGQPVVPSNPFGKYYAVRLDLFTKWRKLRYLNEPQTEVCTSCHRIGDLNYYSCKIMRYSVGIQDIPKSTFKRGAVTNPAWYSMPPKEMLGGNTEDYVRAVNRINQCCADYDSCNYEAATR